MPLEKFSRVSVHVHYDFSSYVGTAVLLMITSINLNRTNLTEMMYQRYYGEIYEEPG
jgi:hypothetical protein